jgi:hypothetical protein
VHSRPRFVDQLTSLARCHAERELLDHLALYKELEEVVFWPDAFASR